MCIRDRLKPFSKDRFESAVQKAIQRISAEKSNAGTALESLKESVQESRGALDRIVTRLGSKVTVIPTDRIWYIESADDYVMIYSELGNHLKEKTMKYFEEHLPANNFVRIHRGSIINLAQIAAIDPYTLSLIHIWYMLFACIPTKKLLLLWPSAKLHVAVSPSRRLPL